MPNYAVCLTINAASLSGIPQSIINPYISDFGCVHKIKASKDGYTVVLQLNGSEELLEVTVREVRFSENKDKVTLSGFEANQPWLANALNKFVAGKEIPVPDFKYKETILSYF